MAFLPKLFRHDQPNACKPLQSKADGGNDKIPPASPNHEANYAEIIVNSGFIIRVIDGNMLSVVSLSENYGFTHKIDEKIMQVIPNRERENFFLILCAMDTMHLIKINNTTKPSTSGELVQRISSFKIDNVTSVEWHPTYPQKFFTAGPYEVCIWNLQQLNSLALKEGPNPVEITLEMASRCAKVLPLAPLYDTLMLRLLKSRQVKLIPGLKPQGVNGNSAMAAVVDDEFVVIINETGEPGDNLSTLYMVKCLHLAKADVAGKSSAFGAQRTHFACGRQLATIVDDQLIIYQLVWSECASVGRTDSINKGKGSNPSAGSEDGLVSESEEEAQMLVFTIMPSSVVKLPITPTSYSIASNALYICSRTASGSSGTVVYAIDLDSLSIRPLKLNLAGDEPSVPFEIDGMAAFSHPSASFLYLTAVGSDGPSEGDCTQQDGCLQLVGKVLNIVYSDECPESCKMSIIRADIGHFGRPERKPVGAESARTSHGCKSAPEGESRFDGSQKPNDFVTSERQGHLEAEMMIRELVLNVIVPGINEALRVSLESMSLQILNHLSSRNGMYSDLVKRLDRIVDRVGELGEKIDEMGKCVSVRIESLEENIESSNYELSAKYQSFDDKLLGELRLFLEVV